MSKINLPFWQTKKLDEMNQTEWESLCDLCGQCCLVRVQDEDSEEIFETNVVCANYDCANQQCASYDNRQQIIPDCTQLTPALVEQFTWLPDSCAYRLIFNNKPLPETHPLVSGNRNTHPNVVDRFQEQELVLYNPDLDITDYVIID